VPDRQEAILAALQACPLYFILDESLFDAHEPVELAREVVEAGVQMLQLRVKQMPHLKLQELALKVREITYDGGCLLIINDSVDLAVSCGADGVHLGVEDAAVAEVRARQPELMIGGTARTPEAAWQAEVDGADYVGSGSVFTSGTKPGLPLIGIEGLAAVNSYVSIPVVGIGGINLDNCSDIVATQVAGFCSIQPFLAGEPSAVVRDFVRRCKPATGET